MLETTDIWGEILAPDAPDMPPEAARYFMSLRFDPKVIERYQVLAERNNQGSITAEEKNELTKLVDSNSFLSLLQLRARLALKRRGSETEG